MVYTLTNIGSQSLNWTTFATENWLEVSPYEGILGPGEIVDVNVCISSDADLLDPNLYSQILTFQNADSNSIKPRLVSLVVKPPDCFTESFGDGGTDLTGYMLTFSPDGSVGCYQACREKTGEFPTEPDGGTFVPLWDDDYVEVVLSDSRHIWFYETTYDRFYIGSNGYITFGDGDTEYDASLENHFNLPRISALFSDLAPLHDHCVSYRQLEDRVVVTFEDVPIYGDKTATNSFQIEMFFADGTICITWLDIAQAPAVAGLSRGRGLPPVFFEQSDLSMYVPCRPFCDFNKDYTVNFADMMVFAEHWLDFDCAIPYWCTQTDIDRSTAVDFGDFAWCAANWHVTDNWWLQPVSHWKFDEGQGDTAYDSAGNNDGTIYGAAWTTGKIGDYALDFDGEDDYVDVNDSPSLDITDKITIAAWVKLNNLSNHCFIVSKQPSGTARDNYAGNYEFRIAQSTGYLKLLHQTSTGETYSYYDSTSSVNAEAWHHVAVTLIEGGNVNFYIDGYPAGISPQQGTFGIFNNEPVRIGTRKDAYSWFNGKIDDVRIYDRALSAEEVRQLYRAGMGNKAFDPNPADGAKGVDPNTVLSWLPGKGALSHDVYLGTNFNDVNDANTSSNEFMGNYDVNSFDPCGLDLETTYYWRIDEVGDSNTYKGNVWCFTIRSDVPNLVSWWKFDEGQGDIAYDSAGDNDGTIYGAAWTSGKIGDWALDFDGDGDYVEIPDNSVLTPHDKITVLFWLYNRGGQDAGIYKYASCPDEPSSPGNSRAYCMGVSDSTGKIGFRIFSSVSNYDTIVSNNTVSLNQWHYIAATFDRGEAAIYIDGQLDNSTTMSVSSIMDDVHHLFIGGCWSYCGTDQFVSALNGRIDDVRIYDRALTAEEVWQLYQQGL